MTAAAALVDDFSGGALDTGRWSQFNVAGVTGLQTGGQYQFVTSNNTPAYSNLTSVDGFDLTGDRFIVKVPTSGDRTIGSLEIYLVAQNGAGTDRIFFVLAGLFMGIYQTVSGVQTGLTFVSYDPAVDVYFRIREASGTTYWDTSTDGRSWTNKFSAANPITVTALHLQVVVGEYGTEPAGATTVAIDDVGRPGAQLVTLTQATEADTATVFGRAKVRTIGQATESDTATTMGRLKTRAIAQATETDTATVVARSKVKAFGQAVEADAATVLGRAKARSIGQAVESDTATALGRAKVRVLGQASELDTATVFGRAKRRLLSQALETDTAGTVRKSGTVVVLGQAVEVDTARHIRAARTVHRPSTGTVTRPSTGTVTRPNTGYVLRP